MLLQFTSGSNQSFGEENMKWLTEISVYKPESVKTL